MALMNKYLLGCSPYIHDLKYDLDKRTVVVTCFRDTIDWAPGKTVTFADVHGFSEQIFEDAFDKELIDSIMGLHMISDGKYCLNTEKRELILQVGTEPVSQDID